MPLPMDDLILSNKSVIGKIPSYLPDERTCFDWALLLHNPSITYLRSGTETAMAAASVEDIGAVLP